MAEAARKAGVVADGGDEVVPRSRDRSRCMPTRESRQGSGQSLIRQTQDRRAQSPSKRRAEARWAGQAMRCDDVLSVNAVSSRIPEPLPGGSEPLPRIHLFQFWVIFALPVILINAS